MKSFSPHLILLALIAFGSTVALGGNAGDRLNSPVSVGQGQSTSLKVLFDEGRGASNASVIVSASGAAMQFTNDGGHLVSLPTITDTLATFGVTGGGTGDTSFTSNAVVVGNGTGALAVVSNNATGTNKFLTQSSSAAPAWSTIIGNDLPLATAATQGAVSITTQTFAGAKTFNGEVTAAGSSPASTFASMVPAVNAATNSAATDSILLGSVANNTPGIIGSSSNNNLTIGYGFFFDGSGSERYAGAANTSRISMGSNTVTFGGDTGSASQNSAVASSTTMLQLTNSAITATPLINANGGIAPGSSSSTLSTYKNRTSYTPAFSGSSVDPSVTYGTRSAYYWQMGDTVFFTFYIQVTAESASGTGNLLVNLPVDTGLTSSQFQEIPCSYGGITLPSSSDTGVFIEIGGSSHFGLFVAPRNTGTTVEDVLPTSSVTVGSFNKFFICTGTYFYQ